jgi:hypothetical protein
MIREEITALKKYLTYETKTNVIIGNKEIDPKQFPAIRIRTAGSLENFKGNERRTTIKIPVELEMLVSADNDMEGLEVLERVLLSIPRFNPEKGHELIGSGGLEYTENEFICTLDYQLNFML